MSSAKVRDKVAEHGPASGCQGRGWDEGKLAERRYIYASDLDPVSPANPVWLPTRWATTASANSRR